MGGVWLTGVGVVLVHLTATRLTYVNMCRRIYRGQRSRIGTKLDQIMSVTQLWRLLERLNMKLAGEGKRRET